MKLKPIRILAGTRSYRGFWLFRVRVERELHQTETDSMPIEVRLATLSSRCVAPLDRQPTQAPDGSPSRTPFRQAPIALCRKSFSSATHWTCVASRRLYSPETPDSQPSPRATIRCPILCGPATLIT